MRANLRVTKFDIFCYYGLFESHLLLQPLEVLGENEAWIIKDLDGSGFVDEMVYFAETRIQFLERIQSQPVIRHFL